MKCISLQNYEVVYCQEREGGSGGRASLYKMLVDVILYRASHGIHNKTFLDLDRV